MHDDTETVNGASSVRETQKRSLVRELAEFAAIALLIILPFRMFVAQPFVVSGASMDPTFHDGEYLVVDQLSKRFEDPSRGSVIILRYPLDTSKFFIKRVIGLPGETLRVKDGAVTIVNKEHPEGFLLDEPYIAFPREDTFERALGSTEYFVMGDNRFGSSDSRSWGPLPAEDIVGRPILRLLPPTRFDYLPGAAHYDNE
jgi:signal peptidase I